MAMQAVDNEVLGRTLAWLEAGKPCWLATVVATWGSSPRPVGSLLACDREGHVTGSLSGGCVEDDLLEKALESGATDVKQVEKVFEVTASPDEMESVRQALERQGMPVLEARVDMVPQSTVRVEGKEAAAVLRLIEALEDQDDVQSVYSNYDIADEVIDAITAA